MTATDSTPIWIWVEQEGSPACPAESYWIVLWEW